MKRTRTKQPGTSLARPASPEPTRMVGEGVRVGGWHWVTYKDWEGKEVTDLMCVSHIGSNFVEFTIYDNEHTQSVNVHFNEFFESCKEEPNWIGVLNQRVIEAQNKMQAGMKRLADRAKSLYLLKDKEQATPESPEEVLPSTFVTDPSEYKNELVKAKDEEFPAIEKEIKEASEQLAIQTKNKYLPSQLQMAVLKDGIADIEDKIFTVELYVGFKEQVKQIKQGKPAPPETSITIRQLLLYMDEETLFDYDQGGMNFENLKQFDEWIVKKANLNRILPEERGIVALRVRRQEKDYGPVLTIGDAFAHAYWHKKDMKTYLLIRNGKNVYRIASDLEFTPRLIPLKDEILGKQSFKKEHEYWSEDDPFPFGERKKRYEEITPDHMDYDEFLLEEIKKIQQYNRIMLIIQGLIDRSSVFDPMPRINIMNLKEATQWINIIRDEETLPAPKLDWEEYRNQLNKSIRKGKMVYASYDKFRYIGWSDKKKCVFSAHGFYRVRSIKRDRSEIEVTEPEAYSMNSYESDGWNTYGRYRGGEPSGRTAHCWIPMKNIFNVSDYTVGDYKMFLCNRAAQGKYLEWASWLLKAEDFALGKAKIEKDQKQ